jgi:hypothetical protein
MRLTPQQQTTLANAGPRLQLGGEIGRTRTAGEPSELPRLVEAESVVPGAEEA